MGAIRHEILLLSLRVGAGAGLEKGLDEFIL